MSICKELSRIQKELKVPKNQRNTFGNYNYRSCEDIVDAFKQIKPDGYSLLLSDEIVNVGDFNYIKATATLTDGNDSIVVVGMAREAVQKKGMDDSQITGATSSYARKYALNGLFAIDDTKDADTQDNSKQELISNDQIKNLESLLKETKSNVDAFYKHFNVKNAKELNQNSFKVAMAMLNKKLTN